MWPRPEKPSYGIFVKRQVDSLIEAGLRCDVLFIHGYRSRLAYPLGALKLLTWNWRRDRRYELVHGHGGEIALAARFYLRAPLLGTYHGSDLLGMPRPDGSVPLVRRIRRWLLRQQARLLDATLTQSREMETTLPRSVRARNAVVPNGVDRNLFRPMDRREARRRVGWNDHERVVLFAADPAVECKRYGLAKDACKAASEQVGDVRLYVATQVVPDDMPTLMNAADCLLLTSSIEGSSTVIKEALMCDVPVIATPAGDAQEILGRVDPSWVCDGTPESLAAAIVECLQNGNRCNGRDVLAWLAHDQVASRILELYGEIERRAVDGRGAIVEARPGGVAGQPRSLPRARLPSLRRSHEPRPRPHADRPTPPLLSLEHFDPDARVLVVTNMWPHEGDPDYGIFIKRQVDSLIAAGLRCDVLFIHGYRSAQAYAEAIRWLVAANRRRPPYALVHGHGGETAIPLRFYVRGPVLVSYCGSDLLGSPRADGTIPVAHRLRRSLLRQHARFLSATLTKSRQMQDVLPPELRARNAVIPNGVDMDLFAPIDRAEARSRLGWEERERVVLFAADPQVERKRHWLAKAACDRAGEKIAGVRLHVAAGVAPMEMPTLMSAADCLLLTSSIEGSPNVIKEALMCNLPVVSTDAGDARELLEGIEPSWLCEDDPESLSRALVECVERPRRSNGRQVSSHLGLEPIAARVLSLYESLAPPSLDGAGYSKHRSQEDHHPAEVDGRATSARGEKERVTRAAGG
jgi:teichuronic acid biosynthesis glycosyltransferase TuaC